MQATEYHYFAGLSVEETAEVLGVSERTVKGDWALARARLFHDLGDAMSGSVAPAGPEPRTSR